VLSSAEAQGKKAQLLGVRDTWQRSVLVQAAAMGLMDVCRVLLDAGADAAVRDKHGLGCADWLFWLVHCETDVIERRAMRPVSYICADWVEFLRTYECPTASETAIDARMCLICRNCVGCC